MLIPLLILVSYNRQLFQEINSVKEIVNGKNKCMKMSKNKLKCQSNS